MASLELGCTDETAVKLAANLARFGPRTLKGRKTLLFVDLSMNHLDMTGCYALEETLKKVDLGWGLAAVRDETSANFKTARTSSTPFGRWFNFAIVSRSGLDACVFSGPPSRSAVGRSAPSSRAGLCAIHGNPGFSGKREPRAPPLDPFALPGHFKSEEQVYYEAVKANGRNLRPVRSGGTSQTDSKTNLLNLRVPTPFMSPRSREALSPRSQYDMAQGSESYLRTTSRKAKERADREAKTFTPLHQKQKKLQMEETGRIKYAPDPRLPPLSFQEDARNLNRFRRRARLARLANAARNGAGNG